MLGILRTQSRLLTIINLALSNTAATVLLLVAVVITLLVSVGGSLIGNIGTGFSLRVEEGGAFLAITWVATILAVLAGSFWFSVWFVEFRKTAFSRRSRTANQIGNWGGILGEVKRDLQTNGHFATHEDHHLKGLSG